MASCFGVRRSCRFSNEVHGSCRGPDFRTVSWPTPRRRRNALLQRPDVPDLDTNTGAVFIPFIDVDVVRYNDKSPWPTNATAWARPLSA
jgi:hypothetical protein